MGIIEDKRLNDWSTSKYQQFKRNEELMRATNYQTLQAHEERRQLEKELRTTENSFINTRTSVDAPWAASPASTVNLNQTMSNFHNDVHKRQMMTTVR
jgi:hypothetical protein